MATNYGDVYNQALTAWNAMSDRDKKIALGATPNYTGDDGIGLDEPTGWASRDPAHLTDFDSQAFWNALGVVPFDPTLRNDGPTPGSPAMSPDQAQAWNDQNARSYNLGDYNTMLQRMTGAGQFVDDPSLGKIWVPNNRDSQSWDKNFVGATNPGNKGFTGWLNNTPGLVGVLGGAITGMGAGDLANGGLDSWSNVLKNYAGAGSNIVGGGEGTTTLGGGSAGTDTLGGNVSGLDADPGGFVNPSTGQVGPGLPGGVDYPGADWTQKIIQDGSKPATPGSGLPLGGSSSILQRILGAAAGPGGSSSSIPWAQILQGGASLASGALGARAASNAADAQLQASQAATAEQRRQFDITQANNAPFLANGTAGNARLAYLMGLGPNNSTLGGNQPLGSDKYGSLIKPFSMSDLNADPVYQSGLKFGLDQGTNAINARAIAGGGYDSGATLKALTQWGNDYGSTKANDAYNRYTADNTNTYNKLAGISGTGQTAVNQVANAGTNATNAISNNITDSGNARAASIVGGAQSWGNAAQGINNAANSYQQNQILQALLGRNSSYGY